MKYFLKIEVLVLLANFLPTDNPQMKTKRQRMEFKPV